MKAAQFRQSQQPVSFMDAKVGQVADVYIDTEQLTEHYCVFGLEWFDERDDEIRLRRQQWLLLEDVPMILPAPVIPDSDHD